MSKARRESHKLLVRSKARAKRLLKTMQKLHRDKSLEVYTVRDPVRISIMRDMFKDMDPDEAVKIFLTNSKKPKMNIKSIYRWVPYKSAKESPMVIPMNEALPNFSLRSKVEMGILFDGLPLHLVKMYRIRNMRSTLIDGTNQYYGVYFAHHGRGGMLRSDSLTSQGMMDNETAFQFNTGYHNNMKQDALLDLAAQPGVKMVGCTCGYEAHGYSKVFSDHIVTILRVINGTPVKEGPMKGMCEVHYMTVPHLADHADVLSAYAWTYNMSKYAIGAQQGNSRT